MPVRESFGQRLRRARQARGLSQEQLAVPAGLSRPTVAAAESDANVRVDTVFRLADVLEVSPAYLLFGIEPTDESGMPTLEGYLRRTMDLTDEQIEHVRRTLIALDAERRLAEREVAEEQEPYSAEAKSGIDSGQDDASTPKDVEPTE